MHLPPERSDKIKFVTIRRHPRNKSMGIMNLPHFSLICGLGKSSITARKKEGDGATPLGQLKVIEVFYRKDKIRFLPSSFKTSVISNKWGWCDESKHPQYNRKIKFPFGASHELLYREDVLYDVILVLDWNYKRRKRNRGSAIFIHIKHGQSSAKKIIPTQGCISMDKLQLMRLLPRLSKKVNFYISM